MGSRDVEAVLTTHKTSEIRTGMGSVARKLEVTTHGRKKSKLAWVVWPGNYMLLPTGVNTQPKTRRKPSIPLSFHKHFIKSLNNFPALILTSLHKYYKLKEFGISI